MIVTKPGIYDGFDESDRSALIPVEPGFSALIDEIDLEIVAHINWRILRGHNGKLYAYANRSRYMHRLIAKTPPGYETDHINGNGLDNRRCNLRVATKSQNSANTWKPKRPDGGSHSSPFKGVSWDKSRNLYQAKIAVNGKLRNLGRYSDEADAARAYDCAAFDAWGDFAVLNFERSK